MNAQGWCVCSAHCRTSWGVLKVRHAFMASRVKTLDLVREGILSGKQITLAQHGENDCECEASKVLQAEVEPN
jgi:hypothetical protein